MFEQEFYIAKLIGAYLQKTITEEEKRRLEAWLDEDPTNRSYFEQVCQEQTLSEKLKTYENSDRDSIWHKTISKIELQDGGFTRPTRHRLYTLRQFAVAAAIATFVFAASLYYYKQFVYDSPTVSTAVQDVAPGREGATLTLANGKQIRLTDVSDGALAEESGVRIIKTADGQLIYELSGSGTDQDAENTLSTSNGETYQIRLPDGSNVWLNAGSILTYTPRLLDGGKRRVKLSGEAYFEVAKDRSKPFIVQTATQEVEVLGTSFNINAYGDEPVVGTTLMEGSIKVTTAHSERIVKPGQQAINNGRHISLSQVDTENVIDWKTGDFYLNHVNFKIAMRKIARWYDIEIVYDDSVPDDMEAGGWISRNRPLSHVLKSIESSGMVKFKIDGRKIHVTHNRSLP